MAALLTIASTRRGTSFKQRTGSGAAMRWLSALLFVLFSAPGLALDEVDDLIARGEAPHGVVFEIVEADDEALQELLPRVRDYIEQLRAKYPDAEFALVSHGREEFALQTKYQQSHADIHQQVQSLVADAVPVHVCETHAGWYGVSAEDFPDYVNVAPTGPGQVNLYRELGYELIIVD